MVRALVGIELCYINAVEYGQLNLKNDTLRRRFDGLKYDLRKVEEGQFRFLLPSLFKRCSSSRLRCVTTQISHAFETMILSSK